MVWFQCEDCGETLKKPKLKGHFNCCSASKLVCIDCGVVFNRGSVQSHTTCMTEMEKFGPKGENGAPKKAAAAAAGAESGRKGGGAGTNKRAEDEGMDFNMGLASRPPWKCSLCNVSATSQETLGSHAEGKKHRSKVRGATRAAAEAAEKTRREEGGGKEEGLPAASGARRGTEEKDLTGGEGRGDSNKEGEGVAGEAHWAAPGEEKAEAGEGKLSGRGEGKEGALRVGRGDQNGEEDGGKGGERVREARTTEQEGERKRKKGGGEVRTTAVASAGQKKDKKGKKRKESGGNGGVEESGGVQQDNEGTKKAEETVEGKQEKKRKMQESKVMMGLGEGHVKGAEAKEIETAGRRREGKNGVEGQQAKKGNEASVERQGKEANGKEGVADVPWKKLIKKTLKQDPSHSIPLKKLRRRALEAALAYVKEKGLNAQSENLRGDLVMQFQSVVDTCKSFKKEGKQIVLCVK